MTRIGQLCGALLLALFAACAATGNAQAIAIISTFDVDAEGWTPNPGEASLAHVAAGGNPGGHIRLTDIGTGGVPFGSGAFASTAFLGDLTAFLGGTLSLDMATFAGGGTTFASFGAIQLSGGGDTATLDIAATAPALNTWQSYSAPLTAAAWGKSDAAFLAILTNVTSIGIPTDAFNGGDTIGIDNFAVTMPSMALPAPATALILLPGLALLGLARTTRRR